MCGIIVFGGRDPETNFLLEESAFQEGFSREACRSAWEKDGAAPLTKACLNNPKVRKSIGDGDDDYQHLVGLIQQANDIATCTLTECGFNGSFLTGKIVPIVRPKIITEEHLLDHRMLLAKASTHGQKFSVTGRAHLTLDDILIGSELALHEKEKTRLTAEKIDVYVTVQLKRMQI